MVLIPPLVKSAGRFHVIDLPGERKLHTVPTARVGGIAFAVATFVSILIWNPGDPVIISYLLGALIILIFGVWDDWANLNFRAKFLSQIIAALVVFFYGKVQIVAFPFFDGVTLPYWLSLPVTILVLLAITNAINLSDGLDGLAGGLSLLSFGGIGYLAYLSGNGTVLLIVISILGGIFGFLRFNTYPARVFMGDGGSQFLGFSLGVLSLVLTDPSHGPYSLLIVLMLVGLPILDTLGVMYQRQKEGRSLFLADKNHTHHKLIGAGLFHDEAVILIYFLQGAFVGLSCLLRFQDDTTILLVYLFLSALFFLFFFRIGRLSLISRFKSSWKAPFNLLNRLKGKIRESGFSYQALDLLIPLFMLLIVFVSPVVPADFAQFSIALLALLIVGVFIFRNGLIQWVRAGLYVGGAFGIFLAESHHLTLLFPVGILLNLFFLLLGTVMMLTIWTDKEGPFRTTPLDYLILAIVLILSIVMKIEIGGMMLGLLAGKLILFFYACEILLIRHSDRLAILSGISVWTLVVLGLRGWVS